MTSFSPHPQRPRCLPDLRHESLRSQTFGQRLLESGQQPRLIQVGHRAMDPQGQACLTGAVLFLDELVVARTAAELGGQGLLEQVEEIGWPRP